VLPALALPGLLASRGSQSDLGAEPSPAPPAAGTGVSVVRAPRVSGRSLPPGGELAGRQPVSARNQLGERAGGGLPRAFLGVALAHGGQRDARRVARALSDRAGASRPLSGAEPFGLFFAQHASAGRGGGAARAGRAVPGISAVGALGGRIVKQQMERQVRGDGSHFEQSAYYHVYALDFFLLYRVLAKPPVAYDARLVSMAEYLDALLGDDG